MYKMIGGVGRRESVCNSAAGKEAGKRETGEVGCPVTVLQKKKHKDTEAKKKWKSKMWEGKSEKFRLGLHSVHKEDLPN